MNFLITIIHFIIFLTILSNAIDLSAGAEPPEEDNREANKTEKSVPDFSQAIYILDQQESKLVKGYEIPFGISLKERSESEISFHVEDRFGIDISKKVEVKQIENSLLVKVTLIEDIPDKSDTLVLYIKAVSSKSSDNFSSCKAVVNIEDNTKPKPTLKFEKQTYDVEILFEQTGLFGQVTAILTGDVNDRPTYLLENISDGKLKDSLKLDKDNGGLSAVQHIHPGVYEIRITAKSSKNENLQDKTTVKLTVKEACSKSSKLSFTEAFVIRNIPDNQIVKNILPGRDAVEGCEYKITSQFPTGDWISLENDTGAVSLKSAISSSSMKIKEIYVELQIICIEDNIDTNKVEEMKIPITDVKNDPKKMILKLVIEKEKSGPPKFTPNSITIGYPKDNDFTTEYPIRLLTTVSVANTEDEIEYSIKESDCPFVIDPKLGSIYPRKYLNKDLTITVIGKNKITNEEGEISIQVKLIATDNIVKAVFEETPLGDIPSILHKLGKESNLQILELSSKPVSEEPIIKKDDKSQEKDIPKFCALIYALKDGNVFPGTELVNVVAKNAKIPRAEVNSIESENRICNCTTVYVRSYSILTVIFAVIVVMTIMGFIITLISWYRGSRFNICWRERRDNVSRMRLSDNTENISSTQWNAQERPFDMISSREFRISDGTLSRDQNDEVVVMGAYGGTSTFRPRPSYNGRSETWENMQVNSGELETELYAITKLQEDKKPEVAVLPVISLPPPNDRKRKRVIKVDDKNTAAVDGDLTQAK